MTIPIRSAMLLAAVVVAIATFALVQQPSPADPPPAPMTASVDDIGKNLILIGRLEKPLGTMMTVRGRWHFPHAEVKDYSLRFTISHVDGEQLDKPVELNVSQVDVVTKERKTAIPPYERHKELEGVEWTLRAYETGRVDMIPQEYFEKPVAFPYWYRPFTSEVVGVLQP